MKSGSWKKMMPVARCRMAFVACTPEEREYAEACDAVRRRDCECDTDNEALPDLQVSLARPRICASRQRGREQQLWHRTGEPVVVCQLAARVSSTTCESNTRVYAEGGLFDEAMELPQPDEAVDLPQLRGHCVPISVYEGYESFAWRTHALSNTGHIAIAQKATGLHRDFLNYGHAGLGLAVQACTEEGVNLPFELIKTSSVWVLCVSARLA